jgi:hypothetical protein
MGEGSWSCFAGKAKLLELWWLDVVKLHAEAGRPDALRSPHGNTEPTISTTNGKELFAPTLGTSQLKY